MCFVLQTGAPPSRPQYVKRLPILEEVGEGSGSSNALLAPLTLANRREEQGIERRVLEDIGSLDARGRTRYPYPPPREVGREYRDAEENLRPLMSRERVPRGAFMEPLESVPLDEELLSRIITEERYACIVFAWYENIFYLFSFSFYFRSC